MHGGSYTSFPEARQKRQEQLGDALKRWNDEERRLFHHMKIMKTRAAQNFKNATKANAAETRWEKFVAAGPPPPSVGVSAPKHAAPPNCEYWVEEAATPREMAEPREGVGESGQAFDLLSGKQQDQLLRDTQLQGATDRRRR